LFTVYSHKNELTPRRDPSELEQLSSDSNENKATITKIVRARNKVLDTLNVTIFIVEYAIDRTD